MHVQYVHVHVYIYTCTCMQVSLYDCMYMYMYAPSLSLSLSLSLSASTIRVDCITVSTLPVKSSIDDQIQQLFDALLNSLRHSISQHLQVTSHLAPHGVFMYSLSSLPLSLQAIDGFLSEARDSLSVRPQTVEEIGQTNLRHAELTKKKPEVQHMSIHVHNTSSNTCI